MTSYFQKICIHVANSNASRARQIVKSVTSVMDTSTFRILCKRILFTCTNTYSLLFFLRIYAFANFYLLLADYFLFLLNYIV